MRFLSSFSACRSSVEVLIINSPNALPTLLLRMNSKLASVAILSFLSAVAFSCDPGYYSHEGSCLSCPPGTYQPESGQAGCKPCPSGEFQSEAASTSCMECGPNSMPNEAASTCDCKPGSVQNATLGQCILCPPGTMYRETGMFAYYPPYDEAPVCETCRRGTFQPHPGQFECLQCPSRSFSAIGASSCIVCPHGQAAIANYSLYSADTGTSVMCGTCPAGMQFVSSLSRCELCEDMYFKADEGLQPCVPCPPETSSTEDRSGCTPCERGTALMEDGACGKCPAGSFYSRGPPRFVYPEPSPLPSNSYCFACESGTFTNYENVMSSCFSCAGHSFSGTGATECITCPQNQVLMSNGSCATCEPGTMYDEKLMECTVCGRNQYTRNINEKWCRSCQKDSYSFEGSYSCTPLKCPEDSIFVHQTSSCGVCPPGTTPGYDISPSCENCTVGYVKPYAGQDGCNYCGLGLTSNEDFTSCITDPDYYSYR